MNYVTKTKLTEVINLTSSPHHDYYSDRYPLYTCYPPEKDCRALLKCPINSVPHNSVILEATLTLNILVPSDTNSTKLTPYPITDYWDINTVTWNTQPLYDYTLPEKSVSISLSGDYIFDITNFVKYWHSSKMTNYGVLLKTPENDSIYHPFKVTYDSPTLDISYRSIPKHPPDDSTFSEIIEEISSVCNIQYSKLITTSIKKTVSFFIKNLGRHPINTRLEISPNGTDFIEDYTDVLINPDEIKILVACHFSKYTRVKLSTIEHPSFIHAKIWYQAQE